MVEMRWKQKFQNQRNFLYRAYPNLAVSGFIMANCILRRVTSNGYENDCAIAPAKPPANSLAGNFKTRPPVCAPIDPKRKITNHFLVHCPQRVERFLVWWSICSNVCTCIFLASITTILRRIFHAKKFHTFEAIKWKSSIWNLRGEKFINFNKWHCSLSSDVGFKLGSNLTIPVKVGTKPRYKPRIPPSCERRECKHLCKW